jgi:hypothetical protein
MRKCYTHQPACPHPKRCINIRYAHITRHTHMYQFVSSGSFSCETSLDDDEPEGLALSSPSPGETKMSGGRRPRPRMWRHTSCLPACLAYLMNQHLLQRSCDPLELHVLETGYSKAEATPAQPPEACFLRNRNYIVTNRVAHRGREVHLLSLCILRRIDVCRIHPRRT